MATANVNQQCSMCNEKNDTFYCNACKQSFCFTHLKEHREKIQQEFHNIEHNYNLFQQNIIDQKKDQNHDSLINKINQWEYNSIKKVNQIADECRQRLLKYTNQYIIKIENKLNNLLEQLKKIHEEKKYNEIDLEELKSKLKKLNQEFDKSKNISIEEEKSSSFINKIFAIIPIDKDTKWKQNAIAIGEFNDEEDAYYGFKPRGVCIDDDQTIYIADYWDDRILEWKSNETKPRIVAVGNGSGNQMNQLSSPNDVIIDKKNNSLIIADQDNGRVMEWSRKNQENNGQVIISDIDCSHLTIDKNGDIYVSDIKKHEVKRWKRGGKEGTLVAGGNGSGDQLNQLSTPTGIFVDDDLSLYVSDRGNGRVMKWVKDAKEGIVVAGGNGPGNSLTQLSGPSALIVDQLAQIYVVDRYNHRVIRWCEGDKQGSIVVGGNGAGKQSNQVNHPTGLSFDRQGNLYVGDSNNRRIQKFEID